MKETPTRLRELFTYDGTNLIWAFSRGKHKVGDVAGSRPSKARYSYVWVDGKVMLTHRVIWAVVHGRWPKTHIDHINRNRLDNRIENLREATPLQQMQNTGPSKRNTSGHRGVTWDKSYGKWKAQIKLGNKNIFLGRGDGIEELAEKYRRARKIYHPFMSESVK